MSDKKDTKTPEQKLASTNAKIEQLDKDRKAFLKGKNLSTKEDHSKSEDKEVAGKEAEFQTRKAELLEKQKKYEGLVGGGKKKKKAKKGSPIKEKYSYPSDVKSSEDKKKYRAKIRALAKKNGVTVEEVLKNVEKYESKAKKASEAKEKEKAKKKKEKEKSEKEKSKKKTKKAKKKEETEDDDDEEDEAAEATSESEEEDED